MNQREKRAGGFPLATAVAMVSTGVSIGLGLAWVGVLRLRKTNEQLQARAAEVDSFLLSLKARQTEGDEQLQQDIALFRQVLTAYQPAPLPTIPAPSHNFNELTRHPSESVGPDTPGALEAFEAANRNVAGFDQAESVSAYIAAVQEGKLAEDINQLRQSSQAFSLASVQGITDEDRNELLYLFGNEE